jgi:hypothetical protein
MDQARPTGKLLDWKPMGTRPVGRPRQRWQEDVMEDLKNREVKNWKETAKDRRTVTTTLHQTHLSFCRCHTRQSLQDYTECCLKVDRQLSRKYFTSDVIYDGSAGMILYYYMCRSWQDCCRRGENRSWSSVSILK